MAFQTRSEAARDYISRLQRNFAQYREIRFLGQDYLFEERSRGGPVVFRMEYAANNLVIPRGLDELKRRQIVDLIPVSKRHRWFRSLQSSQAIAQTIFGAIAVVGPKSVLSGIVADDGQLAFGPLAGDTKIELEKSIATLGEPRPTSIDVWLNGQYQVAIECKLSELDFGRCSRPRLTQKDANYDRDFCDGTYTRQRSRTTNCALTEIGVSYWKHLEALLGWSAEKEQRPCQLASTYQLVRNILAVCVGADGRLNHLAGHVLTVYDKRNPAMAVDGEGMHQWNTVSVALKNPGLLRRISWQSLLSQLPHNPILDDLRGELALKYGFDIG